MSKITADEVNQNSILLSLSQKKFYEALVWWEPEGGPESRRKSKKEKRSKSFIFTTFIPIKQSNLREPLSSVPHHSGRPGI